jgi:hypothetical protein
MGVATDFATSTATQKSTDTNKPTIYNMFASIEADAPKDTSKSFDNFDDQHEGESNVDESKNE